MAKTKVQKIGPATLVIKICMIGSMAVWVRLVHPR